ncbi:MAG: hypothetical protein QOF96_1728, partial [Actinomycetota bacterium]|nr:hypothetical protein [Actinomycetota bacterium]
MRRVPLLTPMPPVSVPQVPPIRWVLPVTPVRPIRWVLPVTPMPPIRWVPPVRPQ